MKKALSVRQPWATLLVQGYKPVENRTWNTLYRGDLLIHAAQAMDRAAMKWLDDNREKLGLPENWGIDAYGWPRGGIIGVVELYAVTGGLQKPPKEAWTSTRAVYLDPTPWFEGNWGLWVRNARELPFLPWRGQLGMFNVDYEL